MIVCRCLTYGRPELLNEAVESFLRQDYVDKHLWILNDYPSVQHSFDHPKVTITNCLKRFDTLGEKWNYLAYHVFDRFSNCVSIDWPDDDIFLPWSLSVVSKHMQHDCYYPSRRYFMNGDSSVSLKEATTFIPAINKRMFEAVQFPHMNSGSDQVFYGASSNYCGVRLGKEPMEDDEVFFIYRWGTGHYHLSGYGREQGGYKKVQESVDAKAISGKHKITPGWKQDYVKLTRDYLESV